MEAYEFPVTPWFSPQNTEVLRSFRILTTKVLRHAAPLVSTTGFDQVWPKVYRWHQFFGVVAYFGHFDTTDRGNYEVHPLGAVAHAIVVLGSLLLMLCSCATAPVDMHWTNIYLDALGDSDQLNGKIWDSWENTDLSYIVLDTRHPNTSSWHILLEGDGLMQILKSLFGSIQALRLGKALSCFRFAWLFRH